MFLQQYAAAPEASRVLFAAHWCQSEIANGGFSQFFANSTGVLAPEGVSAFRDLGMPQTAAVIEKAMAAFGAVYPRDRDARDEALTAICDAVDEESWPFEEFDEAFFDLFRSENGGFDAAADRYAAANGARPADDARA